MTRIDSIIARLHGLHPRLIDLSLGRLHALLEKLDHPERRLPPVVHVAGTNGKGSSCAFLRAMAQAAGWRVHVYTSPHLVHLRERIRVSNELVTDAALSAVLDEIAETNDGAPITVFEVLTAAGLLLFARNPADLCIIEVGLGGRFDATNVVDTPRACAITAISVDHQDFLGADLAGIAAEKAGIIKPGVPVVTGLQPPAVLAVLRAEAARQRAPLLVRDQDWRIAPQGDGLVFADAQGRLLLPRPSLLGAHQQENAGIALAALRAGFAQFPAAAAAGVAQAEWPARLQWLHGTLARRLPPGWELWLDGGHNPGAGVVLAAQLRAWADRPLHLVVGMKQSKDAMEFLRPLVPHASTIWAVAEPGQHNALPVADIIAASGGVARPGPDIAGALAALAGNAASTARVLICGSLYLAGEVLKADAVS